jgi:hypothetical protein
MNWKTIFGQVERMSFKRITMGETCSSRPFAKMVEKFKQKQEMRWAIGKCIKISPTHQHNIDEDIILQKVGGVSKT